MSGMHLRIPSDVKRLLENHHVLFTWWHEMPLPGKGDDFC